MEVRAGRPEYLGGRLLRFGPLMVRNFAYSGSVFRPDTPSNKRSNLVVCSGILGTDLGARMTVRAGTVRWKVGCGCGGNADWRKARNKRNGRENQQGQER